MPEAGRVPDAAVAVGAAGCPAGIGIPGMPGRAPAIMRAGFIA